MNTIESMPNRPLTASELTALEDADGIEAVEAVFHRPSTKEIIAVGLVHESDRVLIGYHPERSRWEVVDRRDRD
jgi:hypothetical protein